MIVVTNGNELFEIPKNKLWKRNETLQGLATKLNFEYWGVELLFIPLKHGKFEKIVKCFPDGDDYLEEYINLNPNKKNYILLSDADYIKVKKIYMAMQGDVNYKKDAIIEGIANIFGFECFQNYILENANTSVDDIFKSAFEIGDKYKEYKDEIFARTREILKKKYKIKKEII